MLRESEVRSLNFFPGKLSGGWLWLLTLDDDEKKRLREENKKKRGEIKFLTFLLKCFVSFNIVVSMSIKFGLSQPIYNHSPSGMKCIKLF